MFSYHKYIIFFCDRYILKMVLGALTMFKFASMFSPDNLMLIGTLTAAVLVIIIIIIYLSYKTGNRTLKNNLLGDSGGSSSPVTVNIFVGQPPYNITTDANPTS
jgi:hypothetical protein